ncbi:MAG: hypothetical protein KME21_30340 [Desmonostoc vinosum HA7617-LM4]|jgi:hypothetical protein|nr:hypothetical protein [Desmonostoc vinosum HA7617-LM4]
MPHPNLDTLIGAAEFILQEIVRHPQFQILDYHPDFTITDAQTALAHLKSQLDHNQNPSITSQISPNK